MTGTETEDPTEIFADIDDVQERLGQVGYLTDAQLATTVFLATRLGRPLLLEGPAGVGKTDLARSLAATLQRRLVRLQCYESQDESKALYEWDYGKQLLYTQILREKIAELIGDAPDLDAAVDRIAERDEVFFSARFLSERPILAAMRSEQPVVLLIDEIDRSDEALEAVLLEVLAENQVSIPEIGTIAAAHPPLVVLTSNNTRDLSTALKRRCLHLFLDYPQQDRELAIVRSKETGLPEATAAQLVALVHELRELELRKAPSIAETVDWARALSVLGTVELDQQTLAATVGVVTKYERDLQRALDHIAKRYGDNPAADQTTADQTGAGTEETESTPTAAPEPEPPEPTQPGSSRHRPPPPPLPDTVSDPVTAADRRAKRDALDAPKRHGAAAFFGGRRADTDPQAGPGSRRRPV